MQVAELLVYAAILIFSIIAHELSHGYVAKLFGDPTAELEGRLTINPISHIDPVGSLMIPAITYYLGGFIFGWAKPVPYNPYNLNPRRLGEFMVAAAGPLTNLGIALIFGGLIRISPALGLDSAPFLTVTSGIVIVNVVLAIFNLLPIPPLDGSKVLAAFMPLRFQGIVHAMENYGLILLLLFLFFIWPQLSPIIYWAFELIVGQPLG